MIALFLLVVQLDQRGVAAARGGVDSKGALHGEARGAGQVADCCKALRSHGNADDPSVSFLPCTLRQYSLDSIRRLGGTAPKLIEKLLTTATSTCGPCASVSRLRQVSASLIERIGNGQEREEQVVRIGVNQAQSGQDVPYQVAVAQPQAFPGRLVATERGECTAMIR